MFDWMKRQGGLKVIDQQSEKKSSLIYQTIDQSNGFYVNSIEKKFRSRVIFLFALLSMVYLTTNSNQHFLAKQLNAI